MVPSAFVTNLVAGTDNALTGPIADHDVVDGLNESLAREGVA